MLDGSLIVTAVARAAVENDPQRALEMLVEDCLTATGATAGRIYLLNLSQTAYVQVQPPEGKVTNPATISLLEKTDGRDDPMLRQAIESKRSLRIPQLREQPIGRTQDLPANSRLLMPIVRDRVCLGVLDLDSLDPDHFTSDHESLMLVAAVVALLICEKEDVLNLLGALQKPIDFRQGFDGFLDEIMLLIASASQMPRIALRELRDDTLHCLKAYGFGNRSEESLHLPPLAEYRLFHDAVAERRTIVARRAGNELAQVFLQKLDLPDVKSFIIVPVLVGKDVFGTLSFAVLCDHEYTKLEQEGLRAIANAVGVAIANYRNFHLAEEQHFEEGKIAAAITTVDVAQSARHEARNLLQAAQERIGVLAGFSQSIQTKFREDYRARIDGLSEELRNVENALQKIKTITKPPEKEKVQYRLDELWREAFGLVLGRLEQQKIGWVVQGTASTRVAVDYVRAAFLNLILNSIDAFRDSKKKGRKIEVTIETPGDRAKEVVMKYVDNASGIDASKLLPQLETGSRTVTDIFLPGVTSKKEGSGYGMYLVRKILTEHEASIDLVDHRNGVTFQIKFNLSKAT
jgi:signal transduction histidine kinase